MGRGLITEKSPMTESYQMSINRIPEPGIWEALKCIGLKCHTKVVATDYNK
jgi:hypothetical protein